MATANTTNDNHSELLLIRDVIIDYCISLKNNNLNRLIETLSKQKNDEIQNLVSHIENLQKEINFKIKQTLINLRKVEFNEALFLYVNILAGKVEKESLDKPQHLTKIINKCKEDIFLKSKKRLATWSKGNGSLAIWGISILVGTIFFTTNSITNKYIYTGIFSYLVPLVTKISLFLATTQGIALSVLLAITGLGLLTHKLTRKQKKEYNTLEINSKVDNLKSNSFISNTSINQNPMYKYNRHDYTSEKHIRKW
jgi:hypothetical protein